MYQTIVEIQERMIVFSEKRQRNVPAACAGILTAVCMICMPQRVSEVVNADVPKEKKINAGTVVLSHMRSIFRIMMERTEEAICP